MSGFVASIRDPAPGPDALDLCSAVVNELSGVGLRRACLALHIGEKAAVSWIDVEDANQRSERRISGVAGVHRMPPDAACPNAFDVGELTVSWIGQPAWQDSPLSPRVTPADLDSEQAVRQWAAGLRGSFQLLIHHRGRDAYAFIADRSSSFPLYFTEHHGCVVSPEPLALVGLMGFGFSPRLRHEAVFEYLALGHLLGDECWWREVKRLGPGRMLWVEGGRPRVSTYWELRAERSGKSNAQLQDELDAALAADCRLTPRGKVALLLSGGYDSRALMGLLHREGIEFEAISYCFAEQYGADWDNDVAAYFARKLGIRHSSYAAPWPDADDIVRRIETAIEATGGENDYVVAHASFLAEPFYVDFAGRFDVMLRGDECFGCRDNALTRPMALWNSLMFRLDQMPPVRRVLSGEAFAEGMRSLDSGFDACFAAAPQTREWNVVKDYFYWRHREARLIQSVAQYRRMFLAQYSPFLFGNTFDVTRQIPSKLRSRKTLFRRAMEKSFPDLFLDETTPSPFTPEVSRFDRFFAEPELQEFTRDALLDRPAESLAEIVDGERLRAYVEAVFAPRAGKDASSSRQDVLRRVYRALRKNPLMAAGATALLAGMKRLKYPAIDNVYLMRTLGLALTLRMYEERTARGRQLAPSAAGR